MTFDTTHFDYFLSVKERLLLFLYSWLSFSSVILTFEKKKYSVRNLTPTLTGALFKKIDIKFG